MKKYWIDARKWDKKIVTTAIESGADAVLVEKGYSKKVKELGLIKTISEDGDIKFNKDVIAMEIKSKKDELDAAKIGKTKSVILKTKDWSIIPLENLIAQSVDIIANVESAKEAKVALEILEKGVNGILLSTTNLNEIKKTGRLVKEIQEQISLVKAKITKINPVGSGDRVCIDTCTNMEEGQGMLVGNSSSGMFLIHSESVENPYVA
ncbi:MAG: 3-dehydroquinate synthase II, partial [Candidatus Aenigmarchaeota archaeon]|nr:3-dehydroquinate synthase II [Candidatus Aenigmarchaeota archaeon]